MATKTSRRKLAAQLKRQIASYQWLLTPGAEKYYLEKGFDIYRARADVTSGILCVSADLYYLERS